jgi:polyhydroxybutyrate depolymerase
MERYALTILIMGFGLLTGPGLVSAQENRTVQVNGTTREYIIDIPSNYDGTSPFGLILCFHGLGGTASGTRPFVRFHTFGSQDSFITVYPQGLDDIASPLAPGDTTTGWKFDLLNNRDVGFVDVLLDSLENEFNIHPDKIFATGISNGGYFSDLLGCFIGDRLAAIAPVIGGYAWLNFCTLSNPLPVFRLGTTEDEIVSIDHLRGATQYWVNHNGCNATPVQEGMCQNYSGCEGGAEVVHCEFECKKSGFQQTCHTWPMAPAYNFETTELILDFFRKHGLSGSTSSIDDSDISDANMSWRTQNFPNPSNPATLIEYYIPIQTHVTLKIYSMQGMLVRTLFSTHKSAGHYKVFWDEIVLSVECPSFVIPNAVRNLLLNIIGDFSPRKAGFEMTRASFL